MRYKKIMATILAISVINTNIVLATGNGEGENFVNVEKVLDEEIKTEKNTLDEEEKVEKDTLIKRIKGRISSPIEKTNRGLLDDNELEFSFEDFLEYKESNLKGFSNYNQKTVNLDRNLDVIETNFKWNDELELTNNPKKIVMHHIAASRPGQTIPVTDVHEWHKANGWAGIGYHFYITKTGKVYRGRPENTIGAHAKGSNKDTLGIAVEGEYQYENMPIAQKNAVIKLGTYLRQKYSTGDIVKHQDVTPTSCPGKNYPFSNIKNEILKASLEEPNYRPLKENDFTINYQAHGEKYAWQKPVSEGQVAGTTGQWKRMEGIKINLVDAPQGLKLKYRTHSAGDRGFRNWKREGELSGTTGQSRRLEAIQIVLEGEVSKNYNIEYRAHIEGKGWLPWVKNGETAGTMGQSRRVEAIQIKLTETREVGVEYRAHGQDYAWQKEYKRDGELAGTKSQWRRMEAIKIRLRNAPEGLGIKYAARVQGEDDFFEWVSSNETAGTTGKWKRLEALKIELTGPKAKEYQIEYRAHGEKYAWQSWKKNGEVAGTLGENKRIEGIEIRIVKKR